MNIRNCGIWGLLAFALLLTFAMPAYGNEVPRITVKQLNEIIDSSDLAILDVRTKKDWGSSDIKVKGAVRVDPKNIKSWAGNYKMDQKIVLYCA